MVILHDAIKTIQNVFLCFFLKNTNLFLFKKPKETYLKKQDWIKKNSFFLNPDYLSILFL